jgi:hypothetical protein
MLAHASSQRATVSRKRGGVMSDSDVAMYAIVYAPAVAGLALVLTIADRLVDRVGHRGGG